MKNKINYLFLISSLLIWIFSFILFLLYIIGLNNETFNRVLADNKTYSIVFVILPIIFSLVLILIYFWLFYTKLKQSEFSFTKKFFKSVYIITGLLTLDLILSCLFSSLASQANSALELKVFISLSFAISSFFLIGLGFYSYYLDIGYNYMINNKDKSARKE